MLKGFATTGTDGVASIINVSGLSLDVYKITATVGGGEPVLETTSLGFIWHSCVNSIAYLAVYDPNGGFVTGGGWIQFAKRWTLLQTQLKAKQILVLFLNTRKEQYSNR